MIKFTRLLLCAVIVLTTISPIHAQNFEDGNTDSLLSLLEHTPNSKERLQVLMQKANKSLGTQEQCIKFTNQLLSEATALGNDRYICEAYMLRIMLAYNTYNINEVVRNFNLLSPIARKINNYDLLFRGWRCLLDMRILTQDFERNEREAQKMLNEAKALRNNVGILEAYQCLANIYRSTFRHEKAAELLERAIPLAIKQKKTGTTTNIWQTLILLYEDMGDLPRWNRSLDGLNKFLHELPAEKLNRKQGILLIMYVSYMNLCTQRDEVAKATQYLASASQYYNDRFSPIYLIYFHRGCYNYYTMVDDDPNALYHIQKTLAILGGISKGVDYHAFKAHEAAAHYRMGHPDQALPIYKQVRAYKDSLHIQTINKQYEQLRKDYTADTLLLKQASFRNRMQIYTLGLLILIVGALAYFVYYLLCNQHNLKVAEREMRLMTRNMERANEAKDRFLSNISTTISQPLNTVVEGSIKLANNDYTTPEERQQMSASIRLMSSDLLKVINDILDLSRLEAGMMKYNDSQTDITTLILDAASVSTAPQGVDFQNTYNSDNRYYIQFDSMRLLQLLSSLFEYPRLGSDKIVAKLSQRGHMFCIHLTGSALELSGNSQERTIRNEINRMLVEHFNGSYQIVLNENGPHIEIQFPITSTTKQTE